MLQDLYAPESVAELAWSTPKWRELRQVLDPLRDTAVASTARSAAYPRPPRLVLLSGPPGCGKLSALLCYFKGEPLDREVEEAVPPFAVQIFHTCEHTAAEYAELLSGFLMECQSAGALPSAPEREDGQGCAATIVKFYGEFASDRVMQLTSSFVESYQRLVEYAFEGDASNSAAALPLHRTANQQKETLFPSSPLTRLLQRHLFLFIHTSHDTHSLKHDRYSAFPSSMLNSKVLIMINCPRLTAINIQKRLYAVLCLELQRRAMERGEIPDARYTKIYSSAASESRSAHRAEIDRLKKAVHTQLIDEESLSTLVVGCAGDLRHALNQLQWLLLLPAQPEKGQQLASSQSAFADEAKFLWCRMQARDGGLFSSLTHRTSAHDEEDERAEEVGMREGATSLLPLVMCGGVRDRVAPLVSGKSEEYKASQDEANTGNATRVRIAQDGGLLPPLMPYSDSRVPAEIKAPEASYATPWEHSEGKGISQVSLSSSSSSSSLRTTATTCSYRTLSASPALSSASPSLAPPPSVSGGGGASIVACRKRSRSLLDIISSSEASEALGRDSALHSSYEISASSKTAMFVGRRRGGARKRSVVEGSAATTTSSVPRPAVHSSRVSATPFSRDETVDLFHSIARLLTQKYALQDVLAKLTVPSRKVVDYLVHNMHSYFKEDEIHEYAACVAAGSYVDTLRSDVEWKERTTGVGHRNGGVLQGRTNEEDSEVTGMLGWHLGQLALLIFNASYRVYHVEVASPGHFVAQLPPPFEPPSYPRIRDAARAPSGLTAFTSASQSGFGSPLQERKSGSATMGGPALIERQWPEWMWERGFLIRWREWAARQRDHASSNYMPTFAPAVVDIVREALPAMLDRCGSLSAILTDYAPYAWLIVLEIPPSMWSGIVSRSAKYRSGLRDRTTAGHDSRTLQGLPPAAGSIASSAPRSVFTLGGRPTVPATRPRRTTFILAPKPPDSVAAAPARSAALLPVTPLQLAILLHNRMSVTSLRSDRFYLLPESYRDGEGAQGLTVEELQRQRNPDDVDIEEIFSDDE